jgi:SNF2 family DNA or RNA helicase
MHFVLPACSVPTKPSAAASHADRKASGTETAGERLRALETPIRPFMMRRTKQAVLVDLRP